MTLKLLKSKKARRVIHNAISKGTFMAAGYMSIMGVIYDAFTDNDPRGVIIMWMGAAYCALWIWVNRNVDA